MVGSLAVKALPGLFGTHAEGPFWDASRGLLGWVDIMAGTLHLTDLLSGEDHVITVGQPLGAAAPRSSGGYVLAVSTGFAVLDEGATRARELARVEGMGGRMNEGKCDPFGRFWAGSMADDLVPGAAAFYRLDADGQVHRALGGVTISNGLDWSADGRTLYYIDSLAGGVDVFDVAPESGALTGRRRVVEIVNDTSVAAGLTVGDGMTRDAEGYVWVAVFGSGEVRRYSPDGRLDAVIRLPVMAPTSCVFGGPELDRLFITTMVVEGHEDETGAGQLYWCDPGVRGTAAHAFAG